MAKKIGTTKLLFNACKSLELSPTWVSDDDLFVINTRSGKRYIKSAASTLNNSNTTRLVQNKIHTRVILEDNGFSNIPFLNTPSLDEARGFLKEHKKIIVKPINGSGSVDIHIVNDQQALQEFDMEKYILEKYVLGKEMRYLLLNNKIIAVHESKYGTSVAADRHLERISLPESEWDKDLSRDALAIADIFDLKFAAVDYLIDPDNNAHILEVNTTPGLKWFHAPTEGPVVDVARMFMESMI